MYYPCSQNKGADQLCSHCTAALRLCFRLCKLLVFSCGGSIFKLTDLNGPSTHLGQLPMKQSTLDEGFSEIQCCSATTVSLSIQATFL